MAGLVLGVHTYKEGYEEGCSLGYLSPRSLSNSIQLALLQAEVGAVTSRCPLQYSLLCNSVKRGSGGTEHSWFCQAGWDWLRTLPCSTFLHPWSCHPDKMTQPGLHAFSNRFCLLTVAVRIGARLVPHRVSPFPELSDMPAVLA